ncbi:MAG: zinc ABC transporter substrate-binding protein [Desulfobacterales bacterium]|nr:zinc ABC transporter substrate-binding protein [Desulfobacterales bacterium]
MKRTIPRFLREIDALDAELKSLFAGSPGARFMVFHPSWGYFAQAYGLEQVPIEIEGKDPKPAQLQGADPARQGARHQGGFRSAAVLREERRDGVPRDRRPGGGRRSAGRQTGRRTCARSAANSRPRLALKVHSYGRTHHRRQRGLVFLQRAAGSPGRRPEGAARGFPGRHRPQRRRQDDPAQADAGAARTHPRDGARLRPAAAEGGPPDRLRAAERPHQQDLSGLGPRRGPDGPAADRQGLVAACPAGPAGRAGGPGAAGRSWACRRPEDRRAVRRPAAARVHRPRAGLGARSPLPGRGHGQHRRPEPRRVLRSR